MTYLLHPREKSYVRGDPEEHTENDRAEKTRECCSLVTEWLWIGVCVSRGFFTELKQSRIQSLCRETSRLRRTCWVDVEGSFHRVQLHLFFVKNQYSMYLGFYVFTVKLKSLIFKTS